MARLSHPVNTPMDDLSDNALSEMAARVFRQGLIDGRNTYPRTRYQVMLLLPVHPHRVIHSRKLRQVYGAGYDISRALREVTAKESAQ